MNSSQLTRVLGLIRKTDDRVVVMDPASDDVVVLLRLGEYERLVHIESNDFDEFEIGDHASGDELPDFFAGDHEPTLNYFENDAALPHAREERGDELEDIFSHDSDITGAGTEIKLQTLTPDWDDEPPAAAANPEQGVEDIAHETEEPPFYLEPVE